jgi:Fe2+ or Zn2+ uptake regulation protein
VLHVKSLRATPARIAIYHLFQTATNPLCAEEILIKIFPANLATVYRILEQFERKKLIEKTSKHREFGSTRKKKRVFYVIF